MPDIIHPSTSESTQNFINEQIGLTFQNSPIDPIANNIQARANQESLFQSLTTYNLEKGPSDVTAYHDFRVLKIAFEDVWQEVFDAKILVGGQRLYERYIELRETYEGLPAPEEITEASPSGEAEEAPSTDEAELITFINEINSAIGTLGSNSEVPPSILAIAPTITNKIFAMLTPSDMAQLQAWSDVYESFLSTNPPLETIVNSINTLWKPWTISLLAKYSSTSTDSIEGILLELNTALRQTYKFRVFAPGSYNFGVLITYRQKWEPGNYQVGNLINTIPLAPKETVKYSKKLVTKKSRQQKEAEGSSSSRKFDSDSTARVDSEIVNKATHRSNFKLNAESSFSIPEVFKVGVSTGIESDSASESAQTKKDFREAVKKAAEEYRQEHKLDIDLLTSSEFEENMAGEISNPNDELTVTYLFYELQRQYTLSEEIQKLTPVIMVARQVPTPDQINEAWIIENDWILKKVILDDSFIPALNYIVDGVQGDNLNLDILKANLDILTSIVQETRSQLKETLVNRNAALDLLAGEQQSLVNHTYAAAATEHTQAVQMLVDQKKAAYDRELATISDLENKLSQNNLALQQAVESYTKALKSFMNMQAEILRLKLHLKNNILYYMQAIWDTEVPDQRFFSFFNIEVTAFVPMDASSSGSGSMHLPPPDLSSETHKLHEIADIDNPIGFKGNYQIFPLKLNNPLTIYMMQEYIQIEDGEIGLRDPDTQGAFDVEAFKAHVQEVFEIEGEEEFNRTHRKQFEEMYLKYLTSGYIQNEEIIIPTKSLFIEALPGAHPVLEDFKLAHRAIDVKKAQAEARRAELENLRLASRLLNQNLEDPDIDKKIVVDGIDNFTVNPTE